MADTSQSTLAEETARVIRERDCHTCPSQDQCECADEAQQRLRKTTHGMVRHLARAGDECVSVTLAGTEHVLPIEDALNLANAIIFTVVDKQPRHMRDRQGWIKKPTA